MNAEQAVALHHAAIEVAIRRACACWRVGGSDAQDMQQDLWLAVLRDDARVLRRFAGRSSITTYLFPIMLRAAGKWIRKRANARRREVLAGDTYSTFENFRAVQPGSAAARESPDRERREGYILRSLRQLPRLDCLILNLRFQDARKVPEIAKLLDLSSKAVEHRLARALIRLRNTLEYPPKHETARKLGMPDAHRH